jgi:hypothetical protein
MLSVHEERVAVLVAGDLQEISGIFTKKFGQCLNGGREDGKLRSSALKVASA